ncbi:Txe/YoeB family addiction module toxin [Psychromonas aquimarina]|uniref:Txe/YoeB family addiction module toxin n=1 Tax=Psychromonas aquimarina TaxID=444919 RepID=UPI000425444F|nr:Txe/YoeB family addiction module toxin [Psychromonas aquimarina]
MAITKKSLDKELEKSKQVFFTPHGWEDYTSWAGDAKKMQRINDLIDAAKLSPLVGIGKPERLSGDLKGYYSRRIDSAHRLIYKIIDGNLCIVSAKFHY